MDLAYLILDLAHDQERRDIIDGSVVVEVIHSIFDSHSCAQWIRMYRDPQFPNGVIMKYRTAAMRFKSIKEFNRIGLDPMLQAILNDALEHAGTNIFTDMDYVTINIHKRKQRLAISHAYFKSELYGDDVCEWGSWTTNAQAKRLRDSFRRQMAFAWKSL
jgi:hypothetical protein